MPATETIDASAIIENQKLNGFVIKLILLSIAITFFDGFDMNVIAYTAPYLGESFHLSKIQLGQLFTAGTFGTLIGGLVFGFLADIYGRRRTIIAAATSFGVLTVLFATANRFHMLLLLRFVNGLAIGGLLPLCWALNIEYVPRRYRATIVTVVMLGYTLGSSLGAPITIWLAPRYGWQAVFLFGGVATLIVAGMLAIGLPESVRYLITREKQPAKVAAYLRGIAPQTAIPNGARFVLSDEVANTRGAPFRLGRLFENELRVITPLLWLAYMASSMAIYFKSNWTPIVFELLGYSRNQAATFSSISAIGSAIGGLLIMRLIDRAGVVAIACMATIAIAPLLIVGLAETGFWAFLIVNFIVNILVGGVHYGMHSVSGLFYPSAFRANGAGWATSIAKFGSIAGPLIGGFILATAFPVKHIFALLAVSPAIVAISLFVMSLAQRARARRIPLEAVAQPA
jgi:AAHS family 4-hydroxybenzoate transporter-like MFS transporter